MEGGGSSRTALEALDVSAVAALVSRSPAVTVPTGETTQVATRRVRANRHGIYVLQSRSSCVLPNDFIDAFPASTMAQEEDFVCLSFAEKSAELLQQQHASDMQLLKTSALD